MGYLFSIEVFIRSFCNRSCLCLYERSSASFLDASPYKREKIIMNNLGGGGFSKVHFQIQTVLNRGTQKAYLVSNLFLLKHF